MIKYIDFDGVLFDSETHLFDDYKLLKNTGKYKNPREYLQDKDWYRYLHKCQLIKDSLEYLKFDRSAIILGKVCSKNEEEAKRRILKELDYNNPCIFMDADEKKSKYVDPIGNILVDDTVHNLDDWKNAGGYPLYFNKDGIQEDPWGNTNTLYKSTRTLKILHYIDESIFK